MDCYLRFHVYCIVISDICKSLKPNTITQTTSSYITQNRKCPNIINVLSEVNTKIYTEAYIYRSLLVINLQQTL